MTDKPSDTVDIWIFKIIGFVIGFVAAVLLEAALVGLLSWIFDARLTGRGLGWIVLPITAGAGCASLAAEIGKNPEIAFSALENFFASAYSKLIRICWSSNKTKRSAIIFPLLWIAFVGLYVLLFRPYGYMSSSDFHHMYKVMLFPPSVILVTYFVYKKLISNSDNNEGT